MKTRKFIYINGIDAASYVLVSLVSVVIPTFVSLLYDGDIPLCTVLILNALVQGREYYMLAKQDTGISIPFWWKRAAGIVSSSFVGCFSIKYILQYLLKDAVIVISYQLKMTLVLLLLVPVVIAASEIVSYIICDFRNGLRRKKVRKRQHCIVSQYTKIV